MAFSQENDVILIKLEGAGDPTVYVPPASYTVRGLASFSNRDFIVEGGHVLLKLDIISDIEDLQANKVDKVTGKGLSTNDLTDELKQGYDTAAAQTHTHDNKSILDDITAPFTDEEKDKLAEAVNAVTVEQMIDTAKQDIDPKVDEIEGELVYVPKTPDSNQMFDKLKIYGQSTQDGTPTPESPIEIKSTKSVFDLTANNSNIMTDEIMYSQGFRKYVDAEKGVAWWRGSNGTVYSHIDIDGNSIGWEAYGALSQAEKGNYIRYERLSDYRIFTNSYGYKGKVSIKYDYKYDHPNLWGAFINVVYKDGTTTDRNIAFSSTWATVSFNTTKEIDYIYFVYGTGSSIPYLHNIQIEFGSVANYHNGENETKQITLKDINNNPIALNGVGDMSDYLDLTTGKAYIKLGKSSADITDAVPNSAYLGTKTSGGLANVDGEIVVKSGETIVYQLAEAYEIDVHPDTLNALRTLKSYSGGTALWNDGGAILNLDYLKIDSDPNYVQFVDKSGKTLAPYTKGNMVGIGEAGGEVVYLTDDDGRLQQIIDGEVIKFTDFGEGVTVTDNLTSTSTTSALSANQGRALDVKKQDKLTAGKGIDITAENVINSLDVFDVVIRTQAEFEALIADPTWRDAKSVAFVGQFELSTANNSGVKRPANVTRIDGYNNAKITVTNFAYDSTTAKGGLWDDENTNKPRCYINDLTVDCTGTGQGTGYGYGFSGSNNTYANCTGTGTEDYGYGFSGNNNIYTNCTGTGTGGGGSFGFGFFGNNNTYTNCTGIGIGGDSGFGFGFDGNNNRIISCTALAYIPTSSTPNDSNCVPIYNYSTSANLFMIIKDCKFPQIEKSGYKQGTIWCNISADNITMKGSIKDNVYHSRFTPTPIKGAGVIEADNYAVDITVI